MIRLPPQDLPSSVEVMAVILKVPTMEVSKTAIKVLPLTVATPVIPSRDVIPAPEMVCDADHDPPPSVEKRSSVSWSLAAFSRE